MHLKWFFNRKDGFAEYWGGHKYLVASLWVWVANHQVLCSKCFSVYLVNNAHG